MSGALVMSGKTVLWVDLSGCILGGDLMVVNGRFCGTMSVAVRARRFLTVFILTPNVFIYTLKEKNASQIVLNFFTCGTVSDTKKKLYNYLVDYLSVKKLLLLLYKTFLCRSIRTVRYFGIKKT